MTRGTGEKPQEVREAKAVVGAQVPNQEPHVTAVAEVALVVVLVEEEEVLVGDNQASAAEMMTMAITIPTKEGRPTR